jgi:hypothetical protein
MEFFSCHEGKTWFMKLAYHHPVSLYIESSTTDKGSGKSGKSYFTEIIISIAVCTTVIILVAICTVMLALYWKFKIKLVRELKNTEGLERFVFFIHKSLDKLSHYPGEMLIHLILQRLCCTLCWIARSLLATWSPLPSLPAEFPTMRR